MAFNLQGGFGAGAGADMLQHILNQHQQDAFEQQRINLAAQEAAQRAAYQAEALKSLEAQRAADEQAAADKRAAGTVSAIGGDAGGTVLEPGSIAAKIIQASNLAPLLQQDKTLGSTNLTGAVGGPLTATANPGQITGRLRLMPTPEQAKADEQRTAITQFLTNPNLSPEARLAIQYEQATGKNPPANLTAAPKSEKQYEVTVPGPNGQPMRKLVSAAELTGGVREYKTPQQAPIQLITTVDENGNPVQKFVKKEEGTNYAKPVSATTETRLKSAQAVQQTGNDIIQELKDPKFAATLGPVLGRYSSLQDFIGNPPPEYAQLAGQIESFALANMGVHGMRSAQGAEQIKKLLNGRHTPESLIRTVEGLNGFSQHFMENSGMKPAGGGGTVKMRAPNGQEQNVPADQVEHYKSLGATVVK